MTEDNLIKEFCVVNLNFLQWREWTGFNDEKIISHREIKGHESGITEQGEMVTLYH